MASTPDEAVEFLRLVQEADAINRPQQLEDLKFRFGDQWPANIVQSRNLEARPCLTINETDAYLRKIENQQRQQRPRMNPHPTGSKATVETAKVLKGLCRHIEVRSDADNAYDLAFMFALSAGVGYFRLRTDYIREDSFDQDIFIDQIENPFSVYFDPYSKLPDGSDAEKTLVTDMMSRDAFKLEYGSDAKQGFTDRSSGDQMADWLTKDSIRVAEYIYVDKVKAELVKLSNGAVIFGDQMPRPEILQSQQITVIGTRPSYKRAVKWCKVTAFEELDAKILPGRFIPIVPVYGIRVMLDGKRRCFGLVRFARDPQAMVNFWQTTLTELAAGSPKAKWLIAEGQDEGHENDYAQSNIKNTAVLRYKPTDVEGKVLPPPVRIEPTAVDPAALLNAQIAGENLKRVLGVFDPQVKTDGNKSGKAINAEKMQAEESNYNFYDNLTRSINHAERIILDWTPTVYDVQRATRIIGDDGKPSVVTLNEKRDEDGVTKILNDVTVGEYDVMMDTGPGYNTKRIEAVDAMMAMTAKNEELWKVAGDLIFRNMDFPGAEVIADRLAASNPLAQIDDKSEIPPKVQMMIAQLQKQLEQAHQIIQQAGLELKFKHGVEKIKQDGATKREEIKAGVKVKDTQTIAATKQHDVEMRALTAQNVAEINGLVQLMLKHIDTTHLQAELEQRDREAESKANEKAATLQ